MRLAVLVPDAEMDTEVGVMEIPIGESLGTLGVELDVLGSNAMATVDTTLLASLERDRESRTQKLSTYLSMRFNHTPTP